MYLLTILTGCRSSLFAYLRSVINPAQLSFWLQAQAATLHIIWHYYISANGVNLTFFMSDIIYWGLGAGAGRLPHCAPCNHILCCQPSLT